MAELRIERTFNADIETVFDFITKAEHLLEWWGPEGVTLPDHALDFTMTGAWHSVMKNADGGSMKVSGYVTHVEAPNSIGFTWAWHDENDQRGPESHVILTLKANANGGTDFSLHHQELANEDAAAAHMEGWTSSLRKLEGLAA